MGKRRSDADYRRFFDEFPCVKFPRLPATGVVQLDAPIPGPRYMAQKTRPR
jgi:hypothetical protein